MGPALTSVYELSRSLLALAVTGFLRAALHASLTSFHTACCRVGGRE